MSRLRNAFTLVELLVVIAIIGILIGMLLPAVQQVREAARRATCMNNIRQLALAAHNYESGHQKLPKGIDIPSTISGTSVKELFGWNTGLLPFMEQNNAYDVLNPNSSVTLFDRAIDPVNGQAVLDVIQSPIPIFQCPSDTTSEVLNRHRPANSSVIGFMAKANYVAANDTGLARPLRDPNTRRAPNGSFDGIEERVLAAMADGTSNTILFAERIYDAVRKNDNMELSGGALQFGPRRINQANDNHFGCAGRINYFDRLADNDIADHGVSSGHHGGIVVAGGDGSAHFISESIDSYYNQNPGVVLSPATADFGTWERLIAVNDGLTVSILD